MVVGLSPSPTHFRVTIRGLPTFVRCGADIQMTGLRMDLDAEAFCPVCENPIRFRIRNRAVGDLQPPDALLHVVETWRGADSWIECDGTHLFDRRECFDRWRRDHAEWRGLISGLQDYLDLCVARRWAAEDAD